MNAYIVAIVRTPFTPLELSTHQHLRSAPHLPQHLAQPALRRYHLGSSCRTRPANNPHAWTPHLASTLSLIHTNIQKPAEPSHLAVACCTTVVSTLSIPAPYSRVWCSSLGLCYAAALAFVNLSFLHPVALFARAVTVGLCCWRDCVVSALHLCRRRHLAHLHFAHTTPPEPSSHVPYMAEPELRSLPLRQHQ